MASRGYLDTDQEYKQLRKQYVDRSFWVSVVGLASVALLVVGGFLGAGAAEIGPFKEVLPTGGLIAGAVVAGTIGTLLGVSNFKRTEALELDRQELDALRRAKHLGKVMEHSKSPEKAFAMAAETQMEGPRRDWREREEARRQERGVSAADIVL